MSKQDDTEDKRLVQPAQALGGAIGGTAGATLGGNYAARFSAKPAARAGMRMGALVRLASKQARPAAGLYGGTAAAIGAHQGRMISRLGRMGVRGGIIGAGMFGASALGDYIGDFAGRRAAGVTGKADEYRHQSLLGMAAGAAGGTAGHFGIGGMRRLRWAAPWRRSTLAGAGGVAGTMAGEASGNVHDARHAVTENVAGADRRLLSLGKADSGPVWLGGYDGKALKPTDSQMGFASAYQRSWLPASGSQKPSTMAAVDSPTGGSTQAQSFSTGFKNWKSRNTGFFASLRNFGGFGASIGSGLTSGLQGDSMSLAAPTGDLAKLRKFAGDESDYQYKGGNFVAGMKALRELGEEPVDGAKRAAWQEQRAAIVRQHGVHRDGHAVLGPVSVGAKPIDIDARLAALKERRSGGPGELSEAEHAQRVAAGKASAAKRRTGNVEGPRLKQPSWYRQARIDPNDKDFDGEGPAQIATAAGGLYRHLEMRPQEPDDMPAEKLAELRRFAGERTNAIRDKVITDSTNKRLIPPGTDPKAVKAAYKHAQHLALHDVGLANMRFRMTPETIVQLKPLHQFIWHARRAQANMLRQEKPGEWAPFRRQFGTPFKDGRTYQVDTQGQKAGEPKKSFYRHMVLVKRWPSWLGA